MLQCEHQTHRRHIEFVNLLDPMKIHRFPLSPIVCTVFQTLCYRYRRHRHHHPRYYQKLDFEFFHSTGDNIIVINKILLKYEIRFTSSS